MSITNDVVCFNNANNMNRKHIEDIPEELDNI